MQETIGDDAVFISADSKGSDVWNQLLDEERLPCRVLITTSVLDCGVNISDDGLRHIVIPFEEHTLFMQALGRVRFRGSPKFTLYVKAISQKRLEGLANRNCELLSLAAEIKRSKCYNSYVDRFRLEGDRAKGALLYLDYGGRYNFNDLLYHKLQRQERYYKELAEAIDQYGDSAFPRLVHQWLGQPDAYDERNWMGYGAARQALQDLLAFLRECDGKSLAAEVDQRAFSEKIHQCYQVVTGDKKRNDRGDGYIKTAALNNCLKKLEINGTVKSNGKSGGWIFSMAEDKK